MPEEKKKPVVKEYDEKNVVVEQAECIRDTGKAVLIALVDGSEHWIPQSNVHDDSEVSKRGDIGKLIVTKWIAIQRKLWEE